MGSPVIPPTLWSPPTSSTRSISFVVHVHTNTDCNQVVSPPYPIGLQFRPLPKLFTLFSSVRLISLINLNSETFVSLITFLKLGIFPKKSFFNKINLSPSIYRREFPSVPLLHWPVNPYWVSPICRIINTESKILFIQVLVLPSWDLESEYTNQNALRVDPWRLPTNSSSDRIRYTDCFCSDRRLVFYLPSPLLLMSFHSVKRVVGIDLSRLLL